MNGTHLGQDPEGDMDSIERTAARIRSAGGCALGAFALWLGPAATAAFLIGLASIAVRLVLVRRKLEQRNSGTAGDLGRNPPTAAV